MLKAFKAKLAQWMFKRLYAQISKLEGYETFIHEVTQGKNTKLYFPVRLFDVEIGDYSYIGQYSHLKKVRIGKFCSIGPKCFFGWGIHPTDGISTSPMFYSTQRQNGVTLANQDKIVEQKTIRIGNDVFIGMNVTILDGVTIGNGAVIGAGAVVSKDIPAYAIAVGNPIKIIRYRFPEEIRKKLLASEWWNMPDDQLPLIEKHFFDPEQFLKSINSKNA
jgi:virginiamycin A acetyltransferase